jgi:hypothetical protein
MKRLQGLLIIIALIGLGLGYIFIRSEQLLQGQIAANIGFIALIGILLANFFIGDDDEE